MKKIVLFTVFCAAVFSPAKSIECWSYAYWYCPVSWKEAKVYFQVNRVLDSSLNTVYVAGEGPLPDSDEGNTVKFPFSYRYGGPYSWVLPWRKGGKLSELAIQINSPISDPKLMDYVIVDNGITHIGNWWFGGLSDLKEAFMPLSLQSIGKGAFNGCRSLLYFDCSDKVKTIDSSAFESCTSLSEFNVYDPTGTYKISEASLNIGSRAFANCGSLKHFKIPAGSTLGNEVFDGSAVESVDLGNNVTFGSNVFQNCKNFRQFTIPANYTLGDGIFSSSCLETVTVNDNVNFGKQSFYCCGNLKSITFRGRINEVTEEMFRLCTGLPSVNIPNGVTSIGNNAFAHCYGLRTVNIPNSVTFIGDRAFVLTSGLTSVTIPNSVTKIGKQAFKQSALTSITVPGSVKAIGESTFEYCVNLTSARICEGVKTVGNSAFYFCAKLETVSFPASLEFIDNDAFAWCGSLKLIECNGTTPPAVNPSAFLASDITETSVCVPYGSVDAYRNADVWKNFKNIGTYPAGIHIINGENFTVNSGTKIKLTAKLLPHDAVPAIIWTSSNKSIASVVDGTVTAYAPGETVITATTGNGIFKDSCKITVKPGNNVPAL